MKNILNFYAVTTASVPSVNSPIEARWSTRTDSNFAASGVGLGRDHGSVWRHTIDDGTVCIKDSVLGNKEGLVVIGLVLDECQLVDSCGRYIHRGTFNKGVYEYKEYLTPKGRSIALVGRRMKLDELSWDDLVLLSGELGRGFGEFLAEKFQLRKLYPEMRSAGLLNEGFYPEPGSDSGAINLKFLGGTGKTAHNIDPPETIVYAHEIETHRWVLRKGSAEYLGSSVDYSLG